LLYLVVFTGVIVRTGKVIRFMLESSLWQHIGIRPLISYNHGLRLLFKYRFGVFLIILDLDKERLAHSEILSW
jgi:hypothetical protein